MKNKNQNNTQLISGERKLRILVVEDNEIHTVLVQYMLNFDIGLVIPPEVTVATDGREAVGILQS